MWDDGCWMTAVFVVTLSDEAVVELSAKTVREKCHRHGRYHSLGF